MATQPRPDTPALTRRGEKQSRPRLVDKSKKNAPHTRDARDATSINPKQRMPIDPSMPYLPPA